MPVLNKCINLYIYLIIVYIFIYWYRNKMTNKTEYIMTTQAKAAKQLKKELKKEFPGVKFSVKSESFSGGDAVRVSYTDGPTTKEVKAIADKYQYGSFDGMRDIYEMTNTDENLPQVKYVTINRSWSDETKEKLFNKIIEDFGLDADTRPSYRLDSGVELRTKAHREFSATSM